VTLVLSIYLFVIESHEFDLVFLLIDIADDGGVVEGVFEVGHELLRLELEDVHEDEGLSVSKDQEGHHHRIVCTYLVEFQQGGLC